MKRLQWLALCSVGAFFLAGCGSDPKPATPNTNVASPTSPKPNPQTTPTPQPSSGLKWNSNEISAQSESCASRGGTDISKATWLTFCTCAYTEAAKKWTYEEFFNDFDENYDTLFSNGAIQTCLDKAGIGNS